MLSQVLSGLTLVRHAVAITLVMGAAGATVELEKVNVDGSVRKLSETTTDYLGEFGFSQPEGPAKLRLKATYKDGKGFSDLQVDSAMIYRLAIKLDISRQPK